MQIEVKRQDFHKIVNHILGGYDVEYYKEVDAGVVFIFEDDNRSFCVELWNDMRTKILFSAYIPRPVDGWNISELTKKIGLAYRMAVA